MDMNFPYNLALTSDSDEMEENMESWSVQKVTEWLGSLGMGLYIDDFLDNNITGQKLLKSNKHYLIEKLNIAPLNATIIIKELCKFKNCHDTAVKNDSNSDYIDNGCDVTQNACQICGTPLEKDVTGKCTSCTKEFKSHVRCGRCRAMVKKKYWDLHALECDPTQYNTNDNMTFKEYMSNSSISKRWDVVENNTHKKNNLNVLPDNDRLNIGRNSKLNKEQTSQKSSNTNGLGTGGIGHPSVPQRSGMSIGPLSTENESEDDFTIETMISHKQKNKIKKKNKKPTLEIRTLNCKLEQFTQHKSDIDDDTDENEDFTNENGNENENEDEKIQTISETNNTASNILKKQPVCLGELKLDNYNELMPFMDNEDSREFYIKVTRVNSKSDFKKPTESEINNCECGEKGGPDCFCDNGTTYAGLKHTDSDNL